MNFLSFLNPQSLLFKVIAWLAIAGVVIGSLVMTAKHFESIGYQKRVAEDQVTLNQELVQSKDKSQSLQHQLNEAQNELFKAKSLLATLTAANHATVDQLRSSFNTFNGNLPNDSRETLNLRIGTLSNVVADCSSRLVEVANDADTRTAEVMMLEKAWP